MAVPTDNASKPKTSLNDDLDTLSSVVSMLYGRIDDIEKQLAPVLLSAPDQSEPSGSNLAAPNSSAFVYSVRSSTARIQDVITRLNDIADRLEL
jgi:hypothetical protein